MEMKRSFHYKVMVTNSLFDNRYLFTFQTHLKYPILTIPQLLDLFLFILLLLFCILLLVLNLSDLLLFLIGKPLHWPNPFVLSFSLISLLSLDFLNAQMVLLRAQFSFLKSYEDFLLFKSLRLVRDWEICEFTNLVLTLKDAPLYTLIILFLEIDF